MKVKDLIKLLSDLDGELDVVVRGYEGGVCDCTVVEAVAIERNVNSAWYYGPHEIRSLAESNAVFVN